MVTEPLPLWTILAARTADLKAERTTYDVWQVTNLNVDQYLKPWGWELLASITPGLVKGAVRYLRVMPWELTWWGELDPNGLAMDAAGRAIFADWDQAGG